MRRSPAGPFAAGLLAVACSAPPRPADLPNLETFRALTLPAPSAQRNGAGRPGAGYWQQQVDYRIEARLDPAAHRIEGTAEILYHNNSPDPLPYLWLHLEQNIHRLDSLSRATGLGDELGTPTAGFEIAWVRTDQAPLELQVHDTVGRIDLPRPIPAGGQLRFSIRWSFAIARDSAMRMGVDSDAESGPVYELAQWFPAVAVYDDAHGWNTLPYLGPGEFYTNFGNFDVALILPRDYLCAATGTLQNPEAVLTADQRRRLREAQASDRTVPIRSRAEVGGPASRPAGSGPLTWRYRAERVRTFAWAASPGFAWDASGVSIGPQDRVLCQSFYAPDAPAIWDASTQMIRHSIAFYSELLLPYPWPQMSNVRGPASGGMEYPMLVFCLLSPSGLGEWYGPGTTPDDPVVLFDLLDHEVGHSWFPMLVNTDERRHAWLDEGLNTFMNVLSHRAYLGEPPLWAGTPYFLEGEDPDLGAAIADPVDHYELLDADARFHLAYLRPAKGLSLLREQVLGPERFDRAFREYASAWAFRSPRPADFFRCIEDAAGVDLAWFWRGWFLENRSLDQAVARVEWLPVMGRVTVTLENRGGLILPVVFRVEYADGTAEDGRVPAEAFYPGDRFRLDWWSDEPVVSLVIDPDGEFPDVDRGNNAWGR